MGADLGTKKSSRNDWKKETDKKIKRMHSLEQKVGDVIQEGEDIDEELERVKDEVEFISKDISAKEEKLKKIMTKRNRDFIDLFGVVPDAKRLKDQHREGQTNAVDKLKNLENEKKKRDADLGTKKSSRNDWK